MLRSIRSRLTMQPVEYLFTDKVSGEMVWEYIDCYGERYMADAHFGFWDFRVRIKS